MDIHIKGGTMIHCDGLRDKERKRETGKQDQTKNEGDMVSSREIKEMQSEQIGIERLRERG